MFDKDKFGGNTITNLPDYFIQDQGDKCNQMKFAQHFTHQSPMLQVETKFLIISAFVDRWKKQSGEGHDGKRFELCLTLKYRFMRMLINWYRTQANLQ